MWRLILPSRAIEPSPFTAAAERFRPAEPNRNHWNSSSAMQEQPRGFSPRWSVLVQDVTACTACRACMNARSRPSSQLCANSATASIRPMTDCPQLSMEVVRALAAVPSALTKARSLLMLTVQRPGRGRSEEHTSELQSHSDLVCRLLLEKKKKK